MKLTQVQKQNLRDLILLSKNGSFQGGSYGTVADRALASKGLVLNGFFVAKVDTVWHKAGTKIPRMVISPLGWEVAKEHGLLDKDAAYPVGYDQMDAM